MMGSAAETSTSVAARSRSPCRLAPLAKAVPAYATAPALLFVACLMIGALRHVAWDDATENVPAALVAVLMPLTFSIAAGIELGFIAYAALKLATGRFCEIDGALALMASLYVVKDLFA